MAHLAPRKLLNPVLSSLAADKHNEQGDDDTKMRVLLMLCRRTEQRWTKRRMVGGESPGRVYDLWPLMSRSTPLVRAWPWVLFRSLLLARTPSR